VDLFHLLKTLINIPSPTGSEGPLADFLAAELARLSFRVRQQRLEGDRRNVWITDGTTPRVILCTHMDTVPGEARAAEDDKFIYGRGACDAKGSMGAMIAAAERLAAEGQSGFGLLFVAGEETDSLGARRANEESPGSEFIVVGEPTGNRLGLGHKGTLFIRLTARGKGAHSAMPQLGESAVDKLLDVLNDIRKIEFGVDEQLGPTLVNIGRIEGGVGVNIVADRAMADLAVRPAVSVADAFDRVAERTAGRAEIEVLTKSEPQRLWTMDGFATAIFPFGTDIPHLPALGKPFLYGPGEPGWAHAAAERVEKSHLTAAVDGYCRLVRGFLADVPLRAPNPTSGSVKETAGPRP